MAALERKEDDNTGLTIRHLGIMFRYVRTATPDNRQCEKAKGFEQPLVMDFHIGPCSGGTERGCSEPFSRPGRFGHIYLNDISGMNGDAIGVTWGKGWESLRIQPSVPELTAGKACHPPDDGYRECQSGSMATPKGTQGPVTPGERPFYPRRTI